MSKWYKELPAGQESLFEPERYDPKHPGAYGMFGYPSACVHEALNQQHEAKIREVVQREFVTSESRCLDGSSLLEYCRDKGKQNSATILRELGFN